MTDHTSFNSPRQAAAASLANAHTASAASSLGDALPSPRIRAAAHQLAQSKVAPGRLAARLGGTLDAECGVLLGHDIILVLRVDGLVLRGDVNVVGGQLVAAELLEQVSVAGPVEVNLGMLGVFILFGDISVILPFSFMILGYLEMVQGKRGLRTWAPGRE